MLTINQFQNRILNWFDHHGRKTLPWQFDKTAYRVWISEIMLQQTQVNTVIPYFERFLTTFPDLETLAHASEDAVLHQWTGLGYYSRARHLHRSAKIILQQYAGNFPRDLTALQLLPGIGRSTAGAILAIAFEKKAAILDGNVKRLLTRLHGIAAWPGEKKIAEKLWLLAEKYTPSTRIGDYTQAMMDIGATLCTRSKPQCETCPLKKYCIAYQKNLTTILPVKKPAKTMPVRTTAFLILKKNPYTIFLEKRATLGIWGGLWSLPEMSGPTSTTAIKSHCKKQFRCNVKQIKYGESFRHTFSHFHLDILPVIVTLNVTRVKTMEAEQQIWYNLKNPQPIGLPAPVKKILLEMPYEQNDTV
jgi:A/G-specific adenine glycosylase